MSNLRWIGAVESFYGPPLSHAARLDLVRYLGEIGASTYAYGPKDDPFHRQRWREPYPDALAGELAELVAAGRACGVDVALGISPGLDWRTGDEKALAAKVRQLRDLGSSSLGVAWDDVEPGGAELGTAHGEATAAAVDAVPDAAWFTCPTDYATAGTTPYLAAFASAVPVEVDIAWTGPSIVSPRVTAADATRWATEIGRPPLFAENFPVNDGTMSGVLHLGPYPQRDPDLPGTTRGVLCNFMSRPRASRVGLACALRFWRDPTSDRESVWREVLASVPGIETLARACRSWVDEPGPDPELAAWAASGDERLLDYLHRDPSAGLDPELAAEVAPWVDQWLLESHALQIALHLAGTAAHRPAGAAFAVAELWRRARSGSVSVFGTRWAHYPVTEWADGELCTRPGALVAGDNLTDAVCRAVLGG